jgi:hypothetical protein
MRSAMGSAMGSAMRSAMQCMEYNEYNEYCGVLLCTAKYCITVVVESCTSSILQELALADHMHGKCTTAELHNCTTAQLHDCTKSRLTQNEYRTKIPFPKLLCCKHCLMQSPHA